MKYYNEEEEYYQSQQDEFEDTFEEEFGCGFCWDKKRQKEKELFFLDNANNMRVCTYCPSCGRRYHEEI